MRQRVAIRNGQTVGSRGRVSVAPAQGDSKRADCSLAGGCCSCASVGRLETSRLEDPEVLGGRVNVGRLGTGRLPLRAPPFICALEELPVR